VHGHDAVIDCRGKPGKDTIGKEGKLAALVARSLRDPVLLGKEMFEDERRAVSHAHALEAIARLTRVRQ
jgi:hypothetical protein